MDVPNLASEIFEKVKTRMEEKGLQSYDEYEQLVDDVIDEMVDTSRMIEEEDTKSLREELQLCFERINGADGLVNDQPNDE